MQSLTRNIVVALILLNVKLFCVKARWSSLAPKPDVSEEVKMLIQGNLTLFMELTDEVFKTTKVLPAKDLIGQAFTALRFAVQALEIDGGNFEPEPNLMEISSRAHAGAQNSSHYDLGRRLLRHLLPIVEEYPGTRMSVSLDNLCRHGARGSLSYRAFCQDVSNVGLAPCCYLLQRIHPIQFHS